VVDDVVWLARVSASPMLSPSHPLSTPIGSESERSMASRT